jgi:two-component system, NtrC family, response regulator AtoC
MTAHDDHATPRDPNTHVARATAVVLLVAGEGRLSSHELTRPIVIGRGAECDVVLASGSLSRRHVIVRPGAPVTVQDLGSTNGTRIGDEVLVGGEALPLEVGDSFHVGPFSFLLVTRSAGTDPSVTGQELLRVVDPTVRGVGAMVRDVAAAEVNVLVLGETGVGKEVLAETLHTLSNRPGALVRINCAALTEPLLESELFGHEKGAFTGASGARVGLLEAAHGGTLFLDEIGELPAGIQAKLLRAVEQREVLRIGSTRPIPIDVRFVAATNRDLPGEVGANRFRRDLYFRLDGVTLSIPPLRERTSQIGPLAIHFLTEACRRAGKPPLQLRTEVLAALEGYAWPGNVRELKAVIERAVLLARGTSPAVRHLVFAPQSAATDGGADVAGAGEPAAPSAPVAAPSSAAPTTTPVDPSAPPPAAPFADGLTADEVTDRDRIIAALEQCAGNQTRAAKLLGVSRSTMINKVRFYRIPRPRS